MSREDAPKLSTAQTDVLRLVARGLSNETIAAQLGIPVGTVKSRINVMHGQLGTNREAQGGVLSRARLVVYAYEHGLMDRPAPVRNPVQTSDPELGKELLTLARMIVRDQPLGALRQVAERAVRLADGRPEPQRFVKTSGHTAA